LVENFSSASSQIKDFAYISFRPKNEYSLKVKKGELMEDKRVHIIHAAESQFIRFGFRKTTMEDIAKAAGIGKATLYYYFKNKEDIFAAMTEKVAQSAIQAIVEATQAVEDPRAKLRIFGKSLAEIMKEKIDYYAAFHEEILELFPTVRKRHMKAQQHGFTVLQDILQEGFDQHVFNISDVKATTELIKTLMISLTEQIMVEERRTTWKEDIERFLDLILKGLEVRG
jgi:AcrR family transcriptional regulator